MARKMKGFFILFCVFVITVNIAFSQDLHNSKESGKIIQIEGQVRIFKPGSIKGKKAVSGMLIFPGDRVQTGIKGWAALVMADESMIQLNKNSVLMLKQIAPKAGWLKAMDREPAVIGPGISEYYLEQGHIWLRNKNTNQKINIDTPYVSTSIRGTELDISIGKDHTVVISVLEGRVQAINPNGSIIVNALEQAVALPGHPIKKHLLLVPEDAVQWTISLQPFIENIFKIVKDSGEIGPGWHYLFQGRPDRAILDFEKGQKTTALELLGLSTALGLLRDFGQAKTVLDKTKQKWPEYAPAWALDSLISLALNDKTGALKSARKAVGLSPGEPLFHVVNALALQAVFDLKGALESTQTALQIDPRNIEGLLNLSRLKLATGYLDEALVAVKKALEREPDNPGGLNLQGFLLLAMLKTNPAIEAFKAAVRLNPYLGEPHIGLSLAYMRQGDTHKAFEHISTAVLIEPQRSVFLSYWAKMLYESKRFKQALDILDLAQRLDPMDPTPLLYRSHILRDLNRIHEAIYALQKAVELNDNQAVYKSRFFLDRDLAVKNVNLALLFYKLGISEWGSVKAMDAVKKDYNNFAAHDFVANQLNYLQGSSSYAARSASLKAFLMKPANANTLNSFNNYTLFFEQPDLSGTITGWAGDMGYRDGTLALHGAFPESNTAFQLTAHKLKHDGWQTHDWQEYQKIKASLKWDISYKDTLSLRTDFSKFKAGDLSSQTQYDTEPDSQNRRETTLENVSAGYVRHLSPDSDILFHFQREFTHKKYGATHLEGTGPAGIFDYQYDYNKDEWLDDPFTTAQAMQAFKRDGHQLSYGAFVYESNRDYKMNAVTDTDYYWAGTHNFVFNNNERSQVQSLKTKSLQSYYVQDIWNPVDCLTIEAAVYVDHIENVNSEENLTWSDSYFNPRFGLIYRPTLKDTIAFSYFKYLEPYESVVRIDAIDVAGRTLSGFYEGSIIEEVALSYSHEWPAGVLLVKGFVNEPDYEYLTIENSAVVQKELDQKYVGFEIAINQLLFKDVGFAAGYTFLDIEKDRATPLMEGDNHWYWARLTKVHPSGIAASIGASYYDTDYESQAKKDSGFLIVSSYIEYELPKKKGKIRLELHNLFDEQFNGVTLSDVAGVIPRRSFAFMLEFNF